MKKPQEILYAFEADLMPSKSFDGHPKGLKSHN